MIPVPTFEQVRSLPAQFDQQVETSFIDENGHMNITDFFRLGAWAPWLWLGEIGVGEEYIARSGHSFFTVEHHIRYLGELRLGERFSVHPGLAGRTDKAVHAVAFVLDRKRERLACAMEIMYVHVSMTERRAAPIPDDLAAGLDERIAAHPWVADAVGGLSLRR